MFKMIYQRFKKLDLARHKTLKYYLIWVYKLRNSTGSALFAHLRRVTAKKPANTGTQVLVLFSRVTCTHRLGNFGCKTCGYSNTWQKYLRVPGYLHLFDTWEQVLVIFLPAGTGTCTRELYSCCSLNTNTYDDAL